MFKSVLVFSVLLAVKILATPLNTRPTHLEDVRVILREEPCVVQGGMCMASEHCDAGDLVRLADLCPKQSNFGVVCCYLSSFGPTVVESYDALLLAPHRS